MSPLPSGAITTANGGSSAMVRSTVSSLPLSLARAVCHASKPPNISVSA
jgi:hypothetical protein